MTDSPISPEDVLRENRWALYYEQYARVLERTRTEVATYHTTGSVFSSAIIKTLLSFNSAAVLGYPIFCPTCPMPCAQHRSTATLNTHFIFSSPRS